MAIIGTLLKSDRGNRENPEYFVLKDGYDGTETEPDDHWNDHIDRERVLLQTGSVIRALTDAEETTALTMIASGEKASADAEIAAAQTRLAAAQAKRGKLAP